MEVSRPYLDGWDEYGVTVGHNPQRLSATGGSPEEAIGGNERRTILGGAAVEDKNRVRGATTRIRYG